MILPLLALLLLFFWVLKRYLKISKQLKGIADSSTSPVLNLIGESALGSSYIRVFGKKKYMRKELEKRVNF